MNPWKEKREIGNATLYLGDCLEILPHLEKVDAVITDPPYAENTHNNSLTNHNPDGKQRDVRNKGGAKYLNFEHWTDDQFVEFCRQCLSTVTRWVVMTCDYHHAPLVFGWPEFVRLGVWVKIAPMPQISGDRPGQGHESVLLLHPAGKKRWNRRGKPAVWTHVVVKDFSFRFQTQKPVSLFEDFVADFTDEGDLVCDPCMGSGTAGVASVQQGRRFVGVEAREAAFTLACERIDQAQRQQRLFA